MEDEPIQSDEELAKNMGLLPKKRHKLTKEERATRDKKIQEEREAKIRARKEAKNSKKPTRHSLLQLFDRPRRGETAHQRTTETNKPRRKGKP